MNLLQVLWLGPLGIALNVLQSTAAIQHIAKRSFLAAYLLSACPNPAYCVGIRLQACMPLATYKPHTRSRSGGQQSTTAE